MASTVDISLFDQSIAKMYEEGNKSDKKGLLLMKPDPTLMTL